MLRQAMVKRFRGLKSASGRAVRTLQRSRATAISGPLVSVVVPAFNEERFLKQCLSSVTSQNYRNLECIVVDDCSTDSTSRIVQEWHAKDPRVRLIRHEVNSGLPASRNTGLRDAKGEYVTFLDGDDYFVQNSLYDRVQALQKAAEDPAVIGSYCQIMSMPETGRPAIERLAPFKTLDRPVIGFLSTNGECPFPAHAPMLRRTVLNRFGGFDATMRDGCEDWELWQRILRAGFYFVPTGTYGGVYRTRRRSMRLSGAAQHSLLAAGLIEKAHRPWRSEDWPVEGHPAPVFTQGLGYYIAGLARAKRLVRGVALAKLSGDIEGVARCLALLPAGQSEWLLRNLNLEADIRGHILMFAGGDAVQAAQLERQWLAAIAMDVKTALERR